MSPDRFLQKLVDNIGMLKVPFVILICVVAIIRVLSAVFVGGQDKREIFVTATTLFGIAALLAYIDKLIIWIFETFR